MQVIAHSTPAGAMRQPVAVKLGTFAADDFRIAIDAPLADAAAIGRSLARLVFPPGIWRLLGESLRRHRIAGGSSDCASACAWTTT